MTEHRHLTDELKFDAQIQFASNGFSEGSMIMWKEDILKLENINVTLQGFHVMVNVLPNSQPWFFFAIYASPDFPTGIQLWNELCSLSHRVSGEWLIEGDFNEVLHAREKLEGSNINNSRASLL
ncbi:hypothetical protein H5410_055734 [Solanum commersonii]|uniref:Uncharacterized protein n=1 Tax=Solanum commersonii TaxID=4109 RepID=A0A9J5WKP4_SOLCO|nr:hypothetical protein H5410_055734 [Solanum commersonii]